MNILDNNSSLNLENERVCTECKNKLPVDDFRLSYMLSGKDKKKLPYRRTKCKVCERVKGRLYKQTDARKEYQANWKRKNKEKVCKYSNDYRKKKKQQIADFIGIVELCSYCLSASQLYDHVIPLEKGGLDHISNLVPACISCNTSKGDKDLLIFLIDRAKEFQINKDC